MNSKLSRVLGAFALTAAVAVTAAAPAAAEEPVTSGNVKFTKNIPYPLKSEGATQEGTDLEFATITVPGTGAAGDLPAGTPAPPVTPISSKAKANKKKRAACIKKAKKAKKNRGKSKKAKRNLAKAIKLCKKKFKSKKAQRAMVDVDGRRAGVQRTYAFAGSYINGLHIVDVSDPSNPIRVTTYDCAITQGDPQVFQRADLGGRWFVTFTADGTAQESKCIDEGDALGFDTSGKGSTGTYIIEVTNPAAPKLASFVHFKKGSHNQTVHPSGKFLYNSNSDLATDAMPGIEVVDISELTAPKEVTTIPMIPSPGLGSNAHDIYFEPDGKRAYCACVSQTVLINTEDPAKPFVISRIPNEYNVSHQAETIETEVSGLGKRTILIVSDEFGGATSTGQCPNGGLHVYDVSPQVELAPVRLGYFNITEVRPTDDGVGTCTAHVYQWHRPENVMIVGWYNAGFRVIDTTSFAGVAFGTTGGTGLKELGFGRFPSGSVWAAKSPTASRTAPFAVYSNDRARGLDAWMVDVASPAQRTGMQYEFTPAALEAPPVSNIPPLGTLQDLFQASHTH